MLVSFFNFEYYSFFFWVFIDYTGHAIIDTLGEGLTAEVYKIEQRINLLESTLNNSRLNTFDSKRHFGNYLIIKSLSSAISGYYGSHFISKFHSLIPFYGLKSIVSAAFLLYVLLIFQEDKKDHIVTDITKIGSKFVTVSSKILKLPIIVPLLYFVVGGWIPLHFGAINYLLLNEGGWTYKDLGNTTLICGIVNLVILSFFINASKAVSLPWIFVYSGIFNAIFFLS